MLVTWEHVEMVVSELGDNQKVCFSQILFCPEQSLGLRVFQLERIVDYLTVFAHILCLIIPFLRK